MKTYKVVLTVDSQTKVEIVNNVKKVAGTKEYLVFTMLDGSARAFNITTVELFDEIEREC